MFIHSLLPTLQELEKCEIPKSETCEYAKAHIHPTKGSAPTSKPDTDGILKASYTCPGACIFAKNSEFRLKRRTLTSFVQ